MTDIEASRIALETLALEYELDDDTLEGLGTEACARLLDGLLSGGDLYRLRLLASDAAFATRDAIAARLGSATELLWSASEASATSVATFVARTAEFELLEILDGIPGVLERVSRRAHLSRPPPASAISVRPPAPALAGARVVRGEQRPSLAPAHSGVVAVQVERLDRLMDAVGELGTVQHGIGALVDKARHGAGQAELLCEAQRLQRCFERSVGTLRSCALQARMVPALAMLDALAACARELGNRCGKPIQIDVDECDLELDKQVADTVFEPLAEWIGRRVELGLQPARAPGRLRLRARSLGSERLIVEIEDDGVAPDPELEFESAPLATLQAQLRAAGASCELAAETGEHNRLLVTLPITRALILTLLVTVRGRMLAIPLASVQEVSRRASGSQAQGDDSFELHDQRVPMVDLGEWLALPIAPNAAPPRHVVAIRHGSRRLAVLVERAIGQQSLLIKPLGPSLRSVRAVTGAADLGDGRLALVLDPVALFEGEHALTAMAALSSRGEQPERGEAR